MSSWIFRVNEIYDDEDFLAIGSVQAGEGTEDIQAIFGHKAFQYPKPPTLIREVLRQASRPDDIVLDFFAGSGTTGQCVLELNDEDGGRRRLSVSVQYSPPVSIEISPPPDLGGGRRWSNEVKRWASALPPACMPAATPRPGLRDRRPGGGGRRPW
ncbi:MAG: DNA methyltransferase, partial [Betaproteobacteria bacterium]